MKQIKPTLWQPLVCALALFTATTTAQADHSGGISSTLVDAGIQFNCGSMGNFNLTYPLLNFGGDDIRSKPVEVRVNGNKAELKYKNNGVVSVSLENGKFKYSFTSVPSGMKSHSHQMFVPFNYNHAGVGHGQP